MNVSREPVRPEFIKNHLAGDDRVVGYLEEFQAVECGVREEACAADCAQPELACEDGMCVIQ